MPGRQSRNYGDLRRFWASAATASRLPDIAPKASADLISYYATADWVPWAYCKDEHGCGHNARIDIAAVIARTGDMPADRFRRRLRCSKCGKRARLVIGHR